MPSITRVYSYGLNELTTPCSVVSYAPYANGTIIRTIRVWLHHMRIRIWYVPYAYSINTRMVQNSYIAKPYNDIARFCIGAVIIPSFRFTSEGKDLKISVLRYLIYAVQIYSTPFLRVRI